MNTTFANPRCWKTFLSLSVVPAMFIVNTVTAADETVPPPPPSRQQMLEQFDTDGDGQLSPDEKAAARASMPDRGPPGGPPGIRNEDMMKFIDTDGDGVISDLEREEARAARAAGKASRKDWDRLLEDFDLDGDGMLSPDEKKAARSSMQGKGKSGGPGAMDRAEMKKRADTDGDGVISDDERAAAKAARQGQGGGKKGSGSKGPRPPAPDQE